MWRIGRLLANCCTFIRYKSEDCCWLLCGDQSAPGGASGGLSDAPRQRITEGILDADATMEGELLGRLLHRRVWHSRLGRTVAARVRDWPGQRQQTAP